MPQGFDVQIRRKVETARLGWPEPGAAGARGMDEGFGGNRAYSDLRSLPWKEARRVLAREQALMARISVSDDPETEYDEITDELYEDSEGLYGLDVGVAATVVALSAARCVPFSSCNGGSFGGCHHELYPLVAFYARPAHVDLLVAAAEEANSGLEHGPRGCLVAFARNIEASVSFAAALIARRSYFQKLRLGLPPTLTRDEVKSSSNQLTLL